MNVRFVLGYLLGLFVRLWTFTYRVVVLAPAGTTEHRPSVFCFWHGQQMALVAARRRACDATVLVSRSRDGEVSAGVMTALGFGVIRGSSSRGGALALRESISALRRGGAALFAVDGPRGPSQVPKPGAAYAASAARAALVPVATAAALRLVLRRAWDGFEIPLPFSRVAVVVGTAVSAPSAVARPELVALALSECRERAEALVGMPRTRSVAHGVVGEAPRGESSR